MSRLDGLTSSQKTLLQLASVIGGRFDAHLLCSIHPSNSGGKRVTLVMVRDLSCA